MAEVRISDLQERADIDLTDFFAVDNATSTRKLAMTTLLSHIADDYQTQTDNSLETTDKTVVGAINELNTHLSNTPIKAVVTGTLGAVGTGVNIDYPDGFTSTNCYGVLMIAANSEGNTFVPAPFFASNDVADFALFSTNIAVNCRGNGYVNRQFKLMLLK